MFVHMDLCFFSTINCKSCKIKGLFFEILLTHIALRNCNNGPIRYWNWWVIFPCYDAEILITINHLYVDMNNQWTSLAICDVTHVSVIDPCQSRNCLDGGICEADRLNAHSAQRPTTRKLVIDSPVATGVAYTEFSTVILWLLKGPQYFRVKRVFMVDSECYKNSWPLASNIRVDKSKEDNLRSVTGNMTTDPWCMLEN
jgi:hypothetical protein